MRNGLRAPCVNGAFLVASMQPVDESLPVVGLPVPEQQVSEPVPRGQREHLLLQLNHGPPPPPQIPETETESTANRTSKPMGWTPPQKTNSAALRFAIRDSD